MSKRSENRKRVYTDVDAEREYQDSLKHHSKEHDANHSISDWILFIEHKLNKVKENLYNYDRINALIQMRKVTALGVACMEYNDANKLISEKIDKDEKMIQIKTDNIDFGQEE